jgi:RNA polymerase subunit RPABC4/transcription elongation factor Spt4
MALTDEQNRPNVPSVATKRCIACKEPIPEDATLCKVCKSDQSNWRNELKYWGGVAGIIALVASGIAFTTSLAYQTLQRVFGTEIAVAEIDPFGKTVVWNLTDAPIYVKTIRVRSSEPKVDVVWDIDKTVAARSDSPIELMKIAADTMHGTIGDIYGKPPGNYAQLDDATLQSLKKNEKTDKFVATFLVRDGVTATQLKRNYKEQFRTFDCSITIDFMRLRGGSSSAVDLPCIGTFRSRT